MSENQLMISVMPPVFDCIILSGGGAKGSFGAGAVHGIQAYRELKRQESGLCLVGTSAGALNAAVIACGGGAQDLVKFWLEVDNRKLLGPFPRWVRMRFLMGAIRRWVRLNSVPFSVYSNDWLRALIRDKIRFDQLKHPLVIAATNYSSGTLKAFYYSPILDSIVSGEIKSLAGATRPSRLKHWTKVTSQEELEDVLLASTAIPVIFPPISLRPTRRADEARIPVAELYVDGGVGNHTPTPDAAIMLKELRRQGLGDVGNVFCIKQDPPTLASSDELKLTARGIFLRTLDVYHFIHTEYVVRGWGRINMEVKRHSERIEEFRQLVRNTDCSVEVKAAIIAEADRLLGSPDSKGERFDSRMIAIEPSQSLGDSLDFDPKKMRANINHGFTAALKALKDLGKLDEHEFEVLRNRPPFQPSFK